MNQWNTQYIYTFLCRHAKAVSFQQTKSSHRAQDMRFISLMFKYFDEAFCTLVMLERPAQSLAYFFYDWLRREKERERKKKINGCELERKWVNASETRDVEFRCMVTDGKPCRNQKIVFIFLWFCSGNIRCKWNPYYRMDGLRNKDKHRLKFAFPQRYFFWENEYCRLLHLFVFSTFISSEPDTTEEQTPNNHLSNAEKAWKKAIIVYTWPTLPKPWRMNKVKKKITSAYNSSPSCLILIAICLKSQVLVLCSCFQSERN